MLAVTVTTTTTQTSKETEEEAEEALVVAEAAAVEEIVEITLQPPNHCLKDNYKIGAYTYTSSLSLKGCIEIHNSRKFMTLCQSYV